MAAPATDMAALVEMLSDVLGHPVSDDGKWIFIDGPGSQPLRQYLTWLCDRAALSQTPPR